MSLRKSLCIIAAVLAVPNAANAQAQIGDVRCLLASSLFANAAKEPKARSAAEVSKYYYLGKINGRLAQAQLRAELLKQSKAITQANAGQTMNTCLRQIQAQSKMVDTTMKQLGRAK